MDNVRQLSEFVNGNVEHLNVLIAFENCEDEAALKKRYLQVRVQKAVESKTILTEEEIIRNLEARRAELIQQLREGDQRIQMAKATLERRVSVKNSCNGLEKSFQSANRAKIREQFPTKFKCAEILKAVCHCLEEVQYQAIGVGRNASDKKDSITQYKNIQQVALELAKILVIIKCGGSREEAERRIEALRPFVNMDVEQAHLDPDHSKNMESNMDKSLKTEREGDHLDLTYLGSIRSNMEELSAKMASLSTHTNHIFEELEQSTLEYSRLLSELPQTIDSAQSKILKAPMYKEPVIINALDTSSLESVVIRHALARPVPDLRSFIESVDMTEASLLEKMRQTRSSVARCKDNFLNRSAKFSAECHALEMLQNPDFKALFP
ncbi:hypothetical protein PSACC_03501 [Paramicrosporidium saccamoebae]|uniref:Uncharacterized protein n=1 Tax=Paramicrosporidium saccamoebae TaxID=1246581 RepID=A0A2H9TGC4_9FUNG|nr:hypothetical protein PSACC_03501 [Paramicrosporidium saccamoebae]